jgi:hypothetical protein
MRRSERLEFGEKEICFFAIPLLHTLLFENVDGYHGQSNQTQSVAI